MAEIIYYPQYGSIRPSGSLRVPVSGHSEDGEAWEGEAEIGLDHPSYAEWRQAIAQKEQHLTILREGRMQAHEARRRAAEWKRLLKDG